MADVGAGGPVEYASPNEESFALHGTRHFTCEPWEIAECPVTEDVSDRIVRLPFYTSMSEEEQGRVIRAMLEF